MPRLLLLMRAAAAVLLSGLLAGASAAAARPAKPAASVPSATSASTAPAAPAGYRIGPAPAWVRPPAGALTPSTVAPNPAGYRELLLDRQILLTADGQQHEFAHARTLITDNAGLQEAAKAELRYNPAFQTLTVHEAAVWRGGVRADRLKGARIEVLRREEGLESLTLTGMKSVLLVLNDVRVGDVVEFASTVSGRNPIYKGHFGENFELAFGVPVDLLSVRIDNASGHPLHARGIRSTYEPEIATEGRSQVLRIVRRDIPPVIAEENVPSWFKVYPSLHVSDYADWNEVARWAQDLFADPGDLGPELTARLEAMRGRNLPPEQLVSDVLGLVQDEVRYFSASLGENSHRPKAPGRTWSERVGDCKDKTALLVAALRQLGFDAQPALVSMHRNKGLVDYLPSHDQFDHVITRLSLGDKTWWLDGTLTGQGRRLETRGYYHYGQVLVVGPQTQGLSAVLPAATAQDGMTYDQRWDLSKPREPARLTSTIVARGLSAEAWRGLVANGALDRVAESLAGNYARTIPGLTSTAAPAVADDRDTNIFTLTLRYEAPVYGQYDRGGVSVDVPAIDIVDWLGGPREARREMPWGIDQTHSALQRVHIVGPRPLGLRPPAPVDVGDRHFSFSQRMDIAGNEATVTWKYERRSDEVLPQDLPSYRERIQAARKLTSPTIRLTLFDFDAVKPALEAATQRVRQRYGDTEDALTEIVLRSEFERVLANESLRITGEASGLGGAILAQRVVLDDNLDDYASTLIDVEKALAFRPDDGELHYARGLALLSQDRAPEALVAMQHALQTRNKAATLRSIGVAQYYAGQYAEAEASLREAVQEAVGDARVFALLWLYMAAERHDGRGQVALAPFLAELDATRWPTVLVRHLAGQASADDVLGEARKERRMERLNLVEAQFYMGQKALIAGDARSAKAQFQRSLDIGASPYVENLFARLELQRLGAR